MTRLTDSIYALVAGDLPPDEWGQAEGVEREHGRHGGGRGGGATTTGSSTPRLPL